MKQIICGDNLKAMNKIPDNSIDLIYLDPPFYSNRQYETIWGDEDEIRHFDDTKKFFADESRRYEAQYGQFVKGISGDIRNYILWMTPRILKMKELLKPTGSIYLHCDWHASHYLKVMMDNIFGYDNFKNEIVWKRTNSAKTSQYDDKKFSVLTDSILFYTKTDDYTFNFNDVKRQLSDEELNEKYDKEDEKGKYRIGQILRSASMGERPTLCYEYKGYKPEKWGWRVSLENLKIIDSKGNLGWNSNGNPYRKHRIEEDTGEAIPNIWDDIKRVNGKESLGYPTQKPEALLERIIKASSNEGDVVLDPFCGCGTAGAVATRLNRKFIGIDISETACKLIAKRLGLTEDQIDVLPTTIEHLKKMKDYEFQQWACDKMWAVNTSKNPKGRSGGDDGRDGVIKGSTSNDFEEGILQVKQSEHITRPVVDQLIGTMNRYKTNKGVIVAYSFTAGAFDEVDRLKHENNIEILLISAKDLLDIERFKYPISKELLEKIKSGKLV